MPLAPEPPASRPPASISVALVEDDPMVQELLAEWIREADGCVCVGRFFDAESAIAGMPAIKPNVVLVDIDLPGASGITCVGTLKPELPNTQFVMLTVYQDSDHIFEALSAGATGYLLKRTTRENLIASLREVHEGGSPMTGHIARMVVHSLQRPIPRSASVEELSKRENEVLAQLAKGYSYKEIAKALEVTIPTVNSFIRRIYDKLHVHSRAQAVAHYVDLPGRKR